MLAITLIPVLGGLICLALKGRRKALLSVVILTVIVTGALLPFILFQESQINIGEWGDIGIRLEMDPLAVPFILSVFIVILATTLNSVKRNYGHLFYSLILILYGTLNAIFLSRDLFNIFVTVELASIISYIMISYEKRARQAWASLKYLMISSLGLSIYLLGIALVYMETGSFALEGLAHVSTVSSVLIFGGLAVKSGLFMFSMWLPDAHSSAPVEVSAILSGLIVKMNVYFAVRFAVFDSFSWITEAYVVIGVGSAILGVIFAISTNDAKKLLAYHTVSQVGFMIVACDMTSAWYAFSHAVFKSLLFLVVGNISVRLKTKNYKKWSRKLDRTEYLFLLIGSLAISGFPLTSGAVTKEIIIHGAGFPWLKVLLLFAATGTAISFSKFVFLKPSKHFSRLPLSTLLAYVVLSVTIIIHGLIGFEMYMLESLLSIGAGIVLYFLLKKHIRPLSPYLERFDNALSAYLLLFVISMVFALFRSSVLPY